MPFLLAVLLIVAHRRQDTVAHLDASTEQQNPETTATRQQIFRLLIVLSLLFVFLSSVIEGENQSDIITKHGKTDLGSNDMSNCIN